jgi:hypothetical protein
MAFPRLARRRTSYGNAMGDGESVEPLLPDEGLSFVWTQA